MTQVGQMSKRRVTLRTGLLCVVVLLMFAGCAAYRSELQHPQLSMPKKLAPAGSFVSSQESDDVRAAMAFDGDAKTRWSSAHADGQWIVADLGADRTVIGVRLVWETAFADEYRIEGSLNNEDWSKIATVRNGDGEEDRLEFSPVTARYIRMFGAHRATEYGFSLYEFEIWGF